MPLRKRALYEAFRASLPPTLRDDRFFKIFYSDVRPSSIAIIGLNPGGEPHAPPPSWGASLFYESGEHDYVDCEYAIAVKMRRLLLESGAAADLNAIRRIPKLNVVFHRSPRWKDLPDKKGASDLARKHLAVILDEISPRLLILEGFESLDQLMRQQSLREADALTVIATRLKTATLKFLDGRRVSAVVLAHPTGSRWSGEHWDAAIALVRSALGNATALCPPSTRPRTATSTLVTPPTRPTTTPSFETTETRDVVRGGSEMGNYAPARLISSDYKIRVVALENPKRLGSKSRVRFERYRN